MSRNKPLIFPGQLRHGIRHAQGGDVAAAIKELLWDCPQAQTPPIDPEQFLAVYCDDGGNRFPACIAGNAKDEWAIEGDGLEIVVPLVYKPIKAHPRCETRRFRIIVRDHSECQYKIPLLYEIVRQRLFPDMLMDPLHPDQDLQIQRAHWILDLEDMPDYNGGRAEIMR
jgi:hypothetical protein